MFKIYHALNVSCSKRHVLKGGSHILRNQPRGGGVQMITGEEVWLLIS